LALALLGATASLFGLDALYGGLVTGAAGAALFGFTLWTGRDRMRGRLRLPTVRVIWF
jgi:hypothetical protein